MAKKKPATKKAAKRTSKKAAGASSATKKTTKKAASKASPKKTTKKSASKSAGASKPAGKTSSSKAASGKKTSSKKAVSKKAPATKPAASQKTSKKPTVATKSASSDAKAKGATKPATKKSASAPAAATSKGPASKDKPGADGKPPRKGITIVENRSRKKKAESKFKPPPSTLGTLLNKRRRQPLIPSGPNAPASEFSKFGEDKDANAPGRKVKSPFKKKELDAFREILLTKRRELAGDVEEMERSMAALGDRGGNPALDVAEQGSDAYDQSLSIGLAEADRKLIRDIDEALRRIDEGVYGVCEVTHEPISTQRLNELPWTRLSIEAARDAERRSVGR